MPIISTLRRHVHAPKGTDGKRIIDQASILEANHAASLIVKKYPLVKIVRPRSSKAERGIIGARQMSTFGKRGRIATRKELTEDGGLFKIPAGLTEKEAQIALKENKKKFYAILEQRFHNNKISARNAWLRGYTFNGTAVPSREIATKIIKRRFGLALAAATGKAGFQSGKVTFDNMLLDNVSHSWMIEAVVKQLTRGLPNPPKMTETAKENEGMELILIKQPNGRFRANLTYEEFSRDVTRNLKLFMPEQLKKHLDK